MKQKVRQLQKILSEMERVLVAYSGGVDSTLLLKLASDKLGDQVTGVLVNSPTLPEIERHQAQELASQLGIKVIELESGEMELPEFLANTSQRCYFCKDHRYQMLKKYAGKNNYHYILDGSNADDLSDHRPGGKAAVEQGVRSPLQEAGLTKKDIRSLAKELNIPNWDKPSSACLASRIPYGTEITPSLLRQVEQAENYLSSLGFREFRVRHHGDIARIEVPPDFFNLVMDHRQEITAAMQRVGFSYITLDLSGFRSGSMNEVLEPHGS